MLKLMDRQLILGYFKAYVITLTSLLSLYIVVDLFTNLDDFTKQKVPFVQVLQHIGSYYAYKIPQIFDRLCEAIVLLAAMFTVTLMQRNNEQLPLLSAGISTHRIVRPVLVCACVMLTMTILNQELLIPLVADRLVYDKDDPDGYKEMAVKGAYEPNGIHIEGDRGSRRGLSIHAFRVTIPESIAGNLLHLTAKEAHYVPGQKGWELSGTRPADLPDPVDSNILQVLDSGRFFLHTREVDFDALTRSGNWFLLASTYRLFEELQKPESAPPAMTVLFHARLTRPLLGLLLVFLGLSMILRDTNRNVILSAGGCLVLCGVFFVVCHSCKMMGEYEYLSPPLAAWMPVLLFGPMGLVLFDAVHT